MAKNWYKFLRLVVIEFLLIFSFWVNNSYAKDFGILGHVYEVKEQNILEYIKSKLKAIDINKLQQEFQAMVKKIVNRPREVKGVIDARENREFFYDPSFILQENIRDHQGNLIHAAGKKINPLEKISLREDLVFINGDNKEQVQFALNYRKRKKGKSKIILTKGSPLELQKKHQIWIYFDQQGLLTSKFGITAVPAVISQDNLRLKISEVAL
jgi:conjugal transfer pilus assembly protein TraW